MKHCVRMALCLMSVMIPAMAVAQENIKKAFDTFIKSSGADVTERRSVTKNPDTGILEGKYEEYSFTLPAGKKSMVKALKDAFEKDNGKSYQYSSGVNSDGESYESLSVGGTSKFVTVGEIKGSSYICALFYDPEDVKRIYRYAYAADWIERDEKITGNLIVTYSTTAKYREEQNRKRIFGEKMNDDKEDNPNLLGEFNIYAGKLRENATSTNLASVYANLIYNLCKKTGSLDASEKKLIADEITDIRKIVNDRFIKSLLDKSVEYLK